MRRLLRWLLGFRESEREPELEKEPEISQEEAFQIARRECEQRGWPGLGKVEVEAERGMWIIRTNTEGFGCNVYIAIDQDTGEVKKTAFAPR